MNKLPAKQIYLLAVIIVGIIALSMYSTFAIFTFDSETSEVINIELPNTLSVSTDMYEYKQLELESKTTVTTDIDIYNTFEYDLCYSIWYKTVGDNSENIEIQELNKENLTTSGTILANNSKRITLLVINNSNTKEIINIGIAAEAKEEVCNLKISTDKKTIRTNYNKDIVYLQDQIKNIVNTPKREENDGVLNYKNINDTITVENEITISHSFTQNKESFALQNSETINLNALSHQENPENLSNSYFCKDKCNTLYKIHRYELNNNKLTISNYDILVPYQKGVSGVKKDNNNYYYYGDNPDNFVKVNCNEESTCELWRIIGMYYDENTKKNYIKLIKNDTIGEYAFNTKKSNTWDENNSMYEYLHKEYKLNTELSKLITDYPLIQETINDNNQITKNEINISAEGKKLQNINILNISDFLNASTCSNKKINSTDCLNGNWLNNTSFESMWTMTNYTQPKPPEEGNEEPTLNENKIISVGNEINKNEVDIKLNIKPTLYISDRVLIEEGNGSFDNPYVLK